MKKRKNHGDKDAAELMSKKSKNHGKNHGDKEVVEVINEKSSDDDNDCDDDDDDDDDDKLGAAKTIPDPFQFCTKLDICNWLVKNPDILRLANEMNESSYVVSSKNTEVSINTI